jgi:hypothetical protein
MSMRDIAITLTIALALVALLAMLFAWRRRLRRDSGLTAPLGVPEHAEVTSRDEVLYVSTTRHDEPLERVTISPLAYRARGVALCLDGAPTVFLASSRLVDVDRATVTIDRVVERGGLVRIAWNASDDVVVDSYLRVVSGDPTSLISDLQRLVPAAPDTGASS